MHVSATYPFALLLVKEHKASSSLSVLFAKPVYGSDKETIAPSIISSLGLKIALGMLAVNEISKCPNHIIANDISKAVKSVTYLCIIVLRSVRVHPSSTPFLQSPPSTLILRS
jgi:hypothetical protein